MFKAIFIFIFAFFPVVLVSAASHVVNLVFTTEPQTVAPGEISQEIGLQMQDSSGNSAAPNETVNLEFFSSSASGEFLNASGNPVSKVWNSNWKNRTFYYRDSSPGVYTLTIKATGRSSGRTWIASQQITIGSGAAKASGGEGSTPSSASQNLLSIQANAGEDKVAVAGAAVDFIGSARGLKGETLEGARFLWNFGDGEVREGRALSHIYRFTGEYLVGLYVSSGEYSASDYLKVKVIPNQIEISGVLSGENGYVGLRNPSDFELDLGGWFLEDSARNRFVIPLQTKIVSRGEITLANEITGLEPDVKTALYLFYPNGREASQHLVNPVQHPVQHRVLNRISTDTDQLPVLTNKATNSAEIAGIKSIGSDSVPQAEETQEFAQISASGLDPILFFALAALISVAAGISFLVIRHYGKI